MTCIITVHRAFDNKDKTEMYCKITREYPDKIIGQSRETLLISKRVWEEIGKTMEWKTK